MTLSPENRIYPTPYLRNSDEKHGARKGLIETECAKNRHDSQFRLLRSLDFKQSFQNTLWLRPTLPSSNIKLDLNKRIQQFHNL